ncbi:MAG: hypothetical protein ACRC0V_01770 [Fusobacteriaceae bacterium]|uniref:hypothetical protein n=1 Tax=Romboutsia sp. TaxID=1965302 RepID=UPI003F306ACC
MDRNEQYYAKNLVNDSLKIFRKDGYVSIADLKNYVEDNVKKEKRKCRKELIDYIVTLFLETDQYKDIKENRVKMCCTCRKILPDTEFRFRSKDSKSRRSICKVCQVEENNKYRSENADRVKEYKLNSYNRVKEDKVKYDKFLEKKRNYRNKHKEKYNAMNRKYFMKKYLVKKLERELSEEEIEKAFELKEELKIDNVKVYKMLYAS